MIGTIRKHSKWMWLIIIAAIIVSFVIYFSPNQQMGGGGGAQGNFGTINGKTVTQEDLIGALHEVKLRYFMNTGEWPDGGARRMGFDAEREPYFRLLLIQKQDELGIHVGSESVAKVASSILRSLNRGNPLPLEVFEKQVLQPQRMTVEDFERFIRHELGMQQLIAVTGLGGKLLTPQDARALYEREHQELSVQAVVFSASNYLADIAAPPEAVSQFYSNQMARYRLPERVQVSYVKFGLSNYLAEATKQFNELTNLNEIIEARYEQLGTNFFAEAKSPEEKKERIRELLFKNQMLFNARKKANEFAAAVFDMLPVRSENLEVVAKTNGLAVELSQPFDKDDGPQDFKVGPDFVKTAFELTVSEPFGGPLIGDDGVYVIAFNRRLPSENPPFETVRDQVTRDYRFTQAVIQARKAGAEFDTALTNGLAAGKSFTAVCTEAKLQPLMPPPFSLSTRTLPEVESRVNLYQFKQASFSTQPGKASPFTPTADGGLIVFVQSKLPLDEARLKTDMPAFMNSIRQTRLNDAFNEWFRREMEKGLRDTPIARPQQPQVAGTPTK